MLSMLRKAYWLARSEYYFYRFMKRRDEEMRYAQSGGDRPKPEFTDWWALHQDAIRKAGFKPWEPSESFLDFTREGEDKNKWKS